ncbi:hypothetical protein ES705_22123 [subsurface metagenome]
MNTIEAIEILSDLRDNPCPEVSAAQCHAIGIAMVVLVSLVPAQREFIDALLAMPGFPNN